MEGIEPDRVIANGGYRTRHMQDFHGGYKTRHSVISMEGIKPNK